MPEFEDFYAILGEGFGPDTPDKEIKKGYRKAALLCHPDKLVGAPPAEQEAAAALFLKLQKAYEILSDPATRQTFDVKVRARAAHEEQKAKANAGRRKMMDALEKKEAEFQEQQNAKRQKTEADASKQKNAEFIEKMKQSGHFQATSMDEIRAQLYKAENEAPQTPTVIVNWTKVDANPSAEEWYDPVTHLPLITDAPTEESIRALLKRCGQIENVLVKAKKRRALVEFLKPSSVDRALALRCSETTDSSFYKLEFKRVARKGGAEPAAAAQPAPQAAAAGFSRPSAGRSVFASAGAKEQGPVFAKAEAMQSHEDYESNILARLMAAKKGKPAAAGN